MSSGFTQTNLLRQELFSFQFLRQQQWWQFKQNSSFLDVSRKKKVFRRSQKLFLFFFLHWECGADPSELLFLQQPKCRQSSFICCFLKAKATNNFQKKNGKLSKIVAFFSFLKRILELIFDFWLLGFQKVLHLGWWNKNNVCFRSGASHKWCPLLLFFKKEHFYFPSFLRSC